MNNTTYHRILRIAALTLAMVLLFDSGLLSPVTSELSHDTQDFLASAIGMQAGVVPTELNQITAELTARDRLLTERENALNAREIEVNLESAGVGTERSTYILSVVLFMILVLLILNYVLDYMRSREPIVITRNEQVV
jgi:hypothetical protein